jgi:Rieske Fe-S protein
MSNIPARVSRRGFCEGACRAASGATLAALFSGCGSGEGGSPTSPSGMVSRLPVVQGRLAGSVVQVSVAGTALNDVGDAAFVESVGGVFLVTRTTANAFTAVEGICTHEGCRVTDFNDAGYVCPCHGSRYSRTGQVLEGPARAALRQHATTFVDGTLTITI